MAAVCWPRLQDFCYSQEDVNLVAAVNAWELRAGALALSVILLPPWQGHSAPSATPKERVAYIEIGKIAERDAA
jgi:hypothetical protein